MLPRPQLSSWFWAIGAAGLVFAARLHEIHLHTGEVAINDQWKIEAADILLPWLNGTLRPSDFFAPHFEHVPLWTRLLVWVEVVLTGRWDPLVQTTVNAAFYAAFIALLTRWVSSLLSPAAALGVSMLFVVGSVLPHAWENITWGFQSQFPLALLFLFLHVQGSFAHPAGSRRWWWAQGAGAAGLFTLAGMWMAPLAVVLAGAWTRTHDSRWRLFPLVLVVAGLGIILLIRATAPSYGAFAQTAGSPLHFVRALLDLLGWPAGWPGALVILNLPWLIFALQLRGRVASTPFDRTVLAFGIWAIGQAGALAFARGSDYGGYVSRYGELLAVLVLANSLALCRVAPASRRWRPASLLFALAWIGVVLTGWWQLSTGGHTAYFHENSAPRAQLRRDALQAYLLHHDRTLLEQPNTRWVLYQDIEQVTRLLDQPDFRALLPASVNPANPTDLIGTLVRTVQSHARIGAGLAGGIFLAGIILSWRRSSGTHTLPAFELQPERLLPWLAAATAIAATALLF
ncbi:MAG: hypothetical protein Q8J74_04555, partial [Candidatus Didemnitutus sp.]|nr:hypothetical protein [Candidatus Didemnitutus sp.]